MREELFRVECGSILTEDDNEFDCYNDVYTKEFGFYDDEVSFHTSFISARLAAFEYVNEYRQRYAAITSDYYDPTQCGMEQLIIDILSGKEFPDDLWKFGYTEDDIVFFVCNNQGFIVVKKQIQGGKT
jgi:hypothetical protein